jgi:hypothetical protein
LQAKARNTLNPAKQFYKNNKKKRITKTRREKFDKKYTFHSRKQQTTYLSKNFDFFKKKYTFVQNLFACPLLFCGGERTNFYFYENKNYLA